MARIADHEIERLKSELSLVRLVEASGIALVKHGKDYLGRCAFHHDKTPSLVVSPDKNLWHCLGACNTGGSVIDWVMKLRGVSFRHAVEILREDDFSSLAADAAHAKRSRVRTLSVPVRADAADAELLNQVADYYHATLKDCPEALGYLKCRGLSHPDVINAFQLGYGNRTLGLRLPEKNRLKGEELRTRLQAIGVIRESGHEHLNGSFVIPIRDAQGHVVQLYGRKIGERLREGTPLHLYLPGPHRGVFNAAALAGQEEVILCEALIDALTFWCAGYRNVTSAYGVNGFTDEHLAFLKTSGARRILIAYDHDPAGDAAAESLSRKLIGEGLDAFRVRFPHGLDANAYALKVQPATKSLGVAIRGAQWLGKGTAPRVTTQEASSPSASVIENPLPSLAAALEEPATKEKTPTPPEPEPVPEPELPEPPAYRIPPGSIALPPVEITERELRLTLSERVYCVRGLEKNLSYERLNVWVRASAGDHVHIDTLELYSAKQRAAFLKQVGIELGVGEEILKSDIAALMRACETRQDELIRQELHPQQATAPELSDQERAAGLELLRDPDLLTRIQRDVEALGVVGEGANTLVSYLACVSRKLNRPLAVLIQSTSAAGKSMLMDTLLSLVPENERVQYSAMTGQSLFYLGEKDLKHKILAIAEEEGVRQAAYALKLLQSQGELTIASTGKDAETGKLVTLEYRVEGPVMLFLTTTAIDLDEELSNRCLILTINETREQTAAIHARQRRERTLAGLLATHTAEAIRAQHRAAQQLLEPIAVVNPFAEQLTYRADATRARRDHQKYLTLIEAITFLHQHQRQKKVIRHQDQDVPYIEVTREDIALANRLAHEVLGRSLDELPPQTRTMLGTICELVERCMREQQVERGAVRFTRRDVRRAAGVSDTQARIHLDRLVQLEYLWPYAGMRGQSFVYELVFDGRLDSSAAQAMGLCEIDGTATTSNLAGVDSQIAGAKRGQNGEVAGGSRSEEPPLKANGHAGFPQVAALESKVTRLRRVAGVVS